jgi:hypothetical protein
MKQFQLSGLIFAITVIGLVGLGSPNHASAQQISLAGTTSPQTGGFVSSDPSSDLTFAEFPGQIDNSDGTPGPYPGSIVDLSFASGPGRGASVNSGKKAKSNPQFNVGFEGLNFYQQRYSRGGNQFSVEPPDQGMCAGNGFVLEVVNDVLNIFNTSGQSALPDNTASNIVAGFARNVNHAIDLNSFYGYAAAINRSNGVRGPFVTDPSCLYDAATQRWFVVVLTLDTFSNGAFAGPNHLDVAVSQTADPTGMWNIYRIPVQDDGTQGTPNHCNGHPCLGDYPHIGADANGFYITTNEFCFFGGCGFGFHAAQIYALSKAQLAAGAASVTFVQLDTANAVNTASGAEPGFTVWPAQSPGTLSFNPNNGGTEFFLSSIAVFDPSGTANQIVEWTLTNTSSLNTASPALNLSNGLITVNQYGVPPKQQQPGSGTAATTDTPLGFCINDTTTVLFNGQTGCWRLVVGPPPHSEVISRPDSNDSRMQQVMYANGKLWGALDTALNPGGGAQRAGLAWYIINPAAGKVALQGYLGAAGYDFTYPAIGVTASGRGVMAFTATGDSTNPSAGFAPIDAIVGVGPWSIVNGGTGAAQDDGFTSYKAEVGNPPRTRWGDYGAAAVDGNSVWIASEYIANPCTYTNWGGPFFFGGSGDNLLGTCGGAGHGPGTRAALGNWSTRISQLTP